MATKGLFVHFRVYPAKDRYFYFTVYVFATKRDMFDFRATLPSRHELHDDYEAVTVQWSEVKNRRAKIPEKRFDRDIGKILFHRRQVGSGVVSHEMTHAALHFLWLGKIKKNPIYNHTLNEALAWSVGFMTSQFLRRY